MAQSSELFESPPCAVCGADSEADRHPLRPSLREVALDCESLAKSFFPSADEPLQDRLVRCRVCGLVYVSPRPAPSVILRGYSRSVDERFLAQRLWRERSFARALATLKALGGPVSGRVADIGAAGGAFLAAARRGGFEPFGCEPNRWLCQMAKEHHGLDLTAGTIFDLRAETASMGLVTMWDVLEHVSDPVAVLIEARRIVSASGRLALSYPDYGSLVARILGDRWPFMITAHLYYFDRDRMERLLERCGFRLIAHRPYWQTLSLGYIGVRARPLIGGWLSRTLASGPWARLPIRYWLGQSLVVAEPTR